MHSANKTCRILTLSYDAEGIVSGYGCSRPVTLESARKRAAVPFTGFGSSPLVQVRERLIVQSVYGSSQLDWMDLMGKPVPVDAPWLIERGAKATR
jgi:hypothetical protein